MTEQPCRAGVAGSHCRPAVDAFVCEPCMDIFHGDLAAASEVAADLEVVEVPKRSRKTTGPSTRMVAKSELPYNPAAAKALSDLKVELVNAVQIVNLRQADGLPDDNIPAICSWLADRERSVALRVEGGQVVTGLRHALSWANRVRDIPPERTYIGRCTCGPVDDPTRLYAIRAPLDRDGNRAERMHTCECGARWPVEQKRAQLEEDLRDYRMTPGEVELVTGGRVKASRVRKWKERGQIEGRRGKYRLADVLGAEERSKTRRAG